MGTKTLTTQIKLRRDNDYNYEAKKNSFIPLKGEVCLVDTAGRGLRAKIGDGVSTWKQLKYSDDGLQNYIVRLGKIYTDSSDNEISIAFRDSQYTLTKTPVDTEKIKRVFCGQPPVGEPIKWDNVENWLAPVGKDVVPAQLEDFMYLSTDGTTKTRHLNSELCILDFEDFLLIGVEGHEFFKITPSYSENSIYIDSSQIFTYDGTIFVSANDTLPTANASTPGIMKLYDDKGQNTDGTMTQKAITDNLNTKVSVEVDGSDSELLIFSTN